MRIGLATVLTILFALDAAAQVTASADQLEQQRALARAAVQQPQTDGALLLPQPQFTLTAEKGKQSVSGTVGIGLDDWSLDATFSGPIGETEDEASPFTLGGLQSGASVRFGLSHGSVTKRRLSDDDLARRDELCDSLNLGNDCDTTDIDDPSARAQFIRIMMPRLPVLWGMHVTLSRQKYVFSTDNGLTDAEPEYHTNQAGTLSLGVLTPNLWFIAAHIEAQKFRRHAGSAVQVCAPIAGSDALSCRTTRLGRPGEPVDASVFTMEGRRVFVGRNVGVNPRFSRDLEEKANLFEMPIYFLRENLDAAKNPVPLLNGGVSLGWHSKNGAELRAFVGVAFKLINLR